MGFYDSYTKNRNLLFSHASAIIYEGAYVLLSLSNYQNHFGSKTKHYNFYILDRNMQWKKYLSDCGDYAGIESLISEAKHFDRQANYVHENRDNIENIMKALRANQTTWNMIYDIIGYYVNEVTGEYVGPNNHRGFVKD